MFISCVQVAKDLCMPVMLPSWVDHCWTHGLDSEVSALDSTIVRARENRIIKQCCAYLLCNVTQYKLLGLRIASP